jgi:hypothetical protein
MIDSPKYKNKYNNWKMLIHNIIRNKFNKSSPFYNIFFKTSGEAALHSFQPILAPMSHNISAVCDVFAARIRALRSKDQGCKNVAEKNRIKARSADCGFS